MSSWDAMSYEAKDTILRVVRTEGDQFLEMVDDDAVWEAPTGAGHWQVRDLVAHIVDTTEAYFVAFDAARSGGEIYPAADAPQWVFEQPGDVAEHALRALENNRRIAVHSMRYRWTAAALRALPNGAVLFALDRWSPFRRGGVIAGTVRLPVPEPAGPGNAA